MTHRGCKCLGLLVLHLDLVMLYLFDLGADLFCLVNQVEHGGVVAVVHLLLDEHA